MGGKPCLDEADRLERKRASARKWALKNYKKISSPEEKKRHCESSKKWYYKNRDKRIEESEIWNAMNPEKIRRYQSKAYYKRIGKPVLFIKKSSIIN